MKGREDNEEDDRGWGEGGTQWICWFTGSCILSTHEWRSPHSWGDQAQQFSAVQGSRRSLLSWSSEPLHRCCGPLQKNQWCTKWSHSKSSLLIQQIEQWCNIPGIPLRSFELSSMSSILGGRKTIVDNEEGTYSHSPIPTCCILLMPQIFTWAGRNWIAVELQ